MKTNRVANKIGKALKDIALFPFWLICRVFQLVSWVLGKVTGWSVLRWALRIVMGLIVLYSLIVWNLDAALILGLPAGFLYVFPYIAATTEGFFGEGARWISSYWHTPAGYSC